MSSYQFKCDLCGGVTEAPTYGDFNCKHCGQVYVYDECHRIELSEPQLQTLRDSRWIPVRERLPQDDENVLVFDPKCFGTHIAWCHKDTTGEIVWASQVYYGLEPTHWMPLPEPPGVT